MEIKFLDTRSAIEKGTSFFVKEPHSAPTPEEWKDTDIKISVFGAGSKAHKVALRDYQEALKELQERKEKAEKAKKPIDTLEIDEEASIIMAKFVAGCTSGWSGLTQDGEELKFSQENAVALYTCSPEVMAQVIGQVSEMERIMGEYKASFENTAK